MRRYFLHWHGMYRKATESVASPYLNWTAATLDSTTSTADWLIGELEAEHAKDHHVLSEESNDLAKRVREVEGKLDRLMAAYLEDALSLGEYQAAKNALVEEKQRLQEQEARTVKDDPSRFEPVHSGPVAHARVAAPVATRCARMGFKWQKKSRL